MEQKKAFTQKYIRSCEMNQKAYNALAQISLWVFLQMLSAVSANFDIANSLVVLTD